MMGPVGVGKSVQGQLLAEKISYNWFSLGKYLRESASESAQEKLASGVLFSDQEVIEIIDSEIGKTITDQTVLDGFPRTLPQSEWIVGLHRENRVNIEAVVVLVADEGVLVDRLLARGRQDDSETVIKERIRTYNSSTRPIIEWFKGQGIEVQEISGVGEIEDISKNILKVLEKDAH